MTAEPLSTPKFGLHASVLSYRDGFEIQPWEEAGVKLIDTRTGESPVGDYSAVCYWEFTPQGAVCAFEWAQLRGRQKGRGGHVYVVAVNGTPFPDIQHPGQGAWRTTDSLMVLGRLTDEDGFDGYSGAPPGACL